MNTHFPKKKLDVQINIGTVAFVGTSCHPDGLHENAELAAPALFTQTSHSGASASPWAPCR